MVPAAERGASDGDRSYEKASVNQPHGGRTGFLSHADVQIRQVDPSFVFPRQFSEQIFKVDGYLQEREGVSLNLST